MCYVIREAFAGWRRILSWRDMGTAVFAFAFLGGAGAEMACHAGIIQ